MKALLPAKQLDLFLLLAGLIKVRELRLFGRGYLLVWTCLVVEVECVINVLEVQLLLFLYFPVGFDLIKKLGAVTCVFLHSCPIQDSRVLSCWVFSSNAAFP